MKCPYCKNAETRVVDSRTTKNGISIRRRRVCDICNKRFTTYEHIEEFIPLVVKKDGRREKFSRTKVIEGIKKACEKRPVKIDDIEEFVDKLEAKIQEEMVKEVESKWIGEEVMKFLQSKDEVAYVRFASVYRSFKDVNEFMKELRNILERNVLNERK